MAKFVKFDTRAIGRYHPQKGGEPDWWEFRICTGEGRKIYINPDCVRYAAIAADGKTTFLQFDQCADKDDGDAIFLAEPLHSVVAKLSAAEGM